MKLILEQLESRIVCDGSIEENVIPLNRNMPLTNGTPAFDLVGQYIDIEVYTLTGTYSVSAPISLYDQIQQLTSAGYIIGYNVSTPTAAPTFFDKMVSTYEDIYTYVVGQQPLTTMKPPPNYFDQVIQEAYDAHIPLIPVGP